MTADGSFTLQVRGSTWTQKMHHAQGAFTESLYIYGSGAKESLKLIDPQNQWKTLSIGLGLGYVEMLLTAVSLKEQRTVKIESYERDPILTTNFSDWINFKTNANSDWDSHYSAIEKRFCVEFNLAEQCIRLELQRLFATQQFRIHGELDSDSLFSNQFDLICFDAFSKEANPTLWSQSFLDTFIQKAAEKQCVFSTYACTGDLKKALKRNSFKLNSFRGFAGKRESTLAIRKL